MGKLKKSPGLQTSGGLRLKDITVSNNDASCYFSNTMIPFLAIFLSSSFAKASRISSKEK